VELVGTQSVFRWLGLSDVLAEQPQHPRLNAPCRCEEGDTVSRVTVVRTERFQTGLEAHLVTIHHDHEAEPSLVVMFTTVCRQDGVTIAAHDPVRGGALSARCFAHLDLSSVELQKSVSNLKMNASCSLSSHQTRM
jgi:hypothetical protein